MSLPTSEMIGTFRADLRRVEITLGARIDARVAANDLWLRDEVQRECQEVRAEMNRLREDIAQRLVDVREDLRRQFNALAETLHRDLRATAESLPVCDSEFESVGRSSHGP